MNNIPSRDDLIKSAASVIRTRRNGDYLTGDVGCALVTPQGNLYEGVCIDVPSSMGFCAEHNAIGSMVTCGESQIVKIVAVWKADNGMPHVVAPCGRCREFMYRIDERNLDTLVILDSDTEVPLREILPYFNSYRAV